MKTLEDKQKADEVVPLNFTSKNSAINHGG